MGEIPVARRVYFRDNWCKSTYVRDMYFDTC